MTRRNHAPDDFDYDLDDYEFRQLQAEGLDTNDEPSGYSLVEYARDVSRIAGKRERMGLKPSSALAKTCISAWQATWTAEVTLRRLSHPELSARLLRAAETDVAATIASLGTESQPDVWLAWTDWYPEWARSVADKIIEHEAAKPGKAARLRAREKARLAEQKRADALSRAKAAILELFLSNPRLNEAGVLGILHCRVDDLPKLLPRHSPEHVATSIAELIDAGRVRKIKPRNSKSGPVLVLVH